MASCAGVDAEHLIDHFHRLILPLLEEFHHSVAAIQSQLRRRIKVCAKLGKGLEFAKAGQVESQPTGHLFHGFGLSSTTYSRDRNANVHGRPLACKEEVGLKIDLAVGDRDDVGWDIRRDLAFERFDDRQRGERSATLLCRELGRPLQ